MARLALPLLMVMVLPPVAQGKEAEKCAALDSKILDLTAKLEAMEIKNKRLEDEIAASKEIPYMSAEVIVDSLGAVSEYAFGKSNNLNVDLAPVLDAANASIQALQSATSQAGDVVSQGYETAKGMIGQAAVAAQDLHEKHVSPHTGEYYKATIESLEPARKVYSDSLHPHVAAASSKIYAGVGAAYDAAYDSASSLTPKVMEVVEQTTSTLSKQGGWRNKLKEFSAPKEVPVFGRKFRFPHGNLDIALAVLQAIVAIVVTFYLSWKLFLKTVIWQICVKLLGKKIVFGLTKKTIKVSYTVTRLAVSIALYLVFTVLAVAFSWVMLAICGGLGVAVFHGIEKNFSVGLSASLRLALGMSIGVLVYLICRCTCCKRKKPAKQPKVATNGTNGKHDPKKATKKEEPKKATAPAAKAPEKPAAKPKKK